MPRILGVDIPNEKKVDARCATCTAWVLTTARRAVADLGIRPEMRAKDLSDEELAKLAAHIEKIMPVEVSCAARCCRTSTG